MSLDSPDGVLTVAWLAFRANPDGYLTAICATGQPALVTHNGQLLFMVRPHDLDLHGLETIELAQLVSDPEGHLMVVAARFEPAIITLDGAAVLQIEPLSTEEVMRRFLQRLTDTGELDARTSGPSLTSAEVLRRFRDHTQH